MHVSGTILTLRKLNSRALDSAELSLVTPEPLVMQGDQAGMRGWIS